MIYYALAIIAATSVDVVDIYTTREPCERDARQLWQMMDTKPSSVKCIPTTESQAQEAQRQLQYLNDIIPWTQRFPQASRP